MEKEIEANVVPETDNDYIQAINDLKANSVSKDSYDKLKSDNKKLLDALVNGGQLESTQEVRSNEELRKVLFQNGNTNNLEFCKAALELRNNVLASEGKDIFLPNSKGYRPDDSEIKTAQMVADIMEECIEYADGDSALFTQELMRRTNESPLYLNKKR